MVDQMGRTQDCIESCADHTLEIAKLANFKYAIAIIKLLLYFVINLTNQRDSKETFR